MVFDTKDADQYIIKFKIKDADEIEEQDKSIKSVSFQSNA